MYYISSLAGSEADSVKHLYTSLDDAYGCLGVLQLPLGESFVFFLHPTLSYKLQTLISIRKQCILFTESLTNFELCIDLICLPL